MEQRKNKSSKLQKFLIAIVIVYLTGLFVVVAGPFIKMVFKLYPSQAYRMIDDSEKIILWENYKSAAYKRGFWGLKRIGSFEEDAEETEEEKSIAEKYSSVYDISESGRVIAYYDYDSDEICFCELENSDEKRFEVCENTIDQLQISPNEKYILYREIEYGYYGDGMTGDEYCYYQILDLETGNIITIYQGYQEWYNISWE